MRFLCLLLALTIFISCKTTQSSDDSSAAVMTAPTGLTGPAYDPSTSPISASQMPAPPLPAGQAPVVPQPGVYDANVPTQAGSAPTAYGSVPLEPATAAKGESALSAPASTYAPQAYSPNGTPAAYTPEAYSAVNAPTAYAAPATAPMPGTAEASLAQQIAGRWVNGTDEREMVEFTPITTPLITTGRCSFRNR